MTKSVVIIGGGLGGLFTGALLAREGHKVTVLEKNATIGGGLQTFSRFGESFDTGMHVFGGLQPGGNIQRICRYLGIFDKIDFKNVDDDCADSLYFAEDDMHYEVAKGREGFAASFARYFPQEKENLKRYVDAIYNISSKVDLFNLRPSPVQFSILTENEDFLMSASDFIAKYIKDEKLRAVLAYLNPLYGGRKGKTPAYIHSIISTLYMNGASRFVGGSSRFAKLLAGVIEEAGGCVKTSEGAEWLEIENREVKHVRSTKGNIYTADCYVSAIHPCTLLGMLNEKEFPKAYRDRLNLIPNAYSAFILNIKLKPESFPYINHTEFYMTRYSDIWNCGTAEGWPIGFLFMTPPEDNQGPWTNKVIITAPMPYETVKKWENTKVGRRGAEYESWKEEKARLLLKCVEKIHPGFKECIENINTASPLTIRDFYGTKEGTLYGFSKDCNNIALSQVPVGTKVKNLFLTGQNVNLHGFCGVPLTAINTAEAILGLNHVINRINECVKD